MAPPTPYISRFTEHFDAPPPGTRAANTALSEALRLELADASQTRDAVARAVAPVAAELHTLAQIHRDLTAVLANYHHFYTSRGLPPRQDPACPPSPLDVQARELGDRVAYLREHRRLLGERLRCWDVRLRALRAELRAACYMVAYVERPRARDRAAEEGSRIGTRLLAGAPLRPPPRTPPPPVRPPPSPPLSVSL